MRRAEWYKASTCLRNSGDAGMACMSWSVEAASVRFDARSLAPPVRNCYVFARRPGTELLLQPTKQYCAMALQPIRIIAIGTIWIVRRAGQDSSGLNQPI